MKYFAPITRGVNVMPLLLDLQRQPYLWDKNPCRLSTRGPHHESQDIFIRYKDERPNLASGDWRDFCDPHVPEWYQSSDLLPGARAIALDLMAAVRGEMLGGVFLYKVEPGKRIHKHTDTGWHPSYYDKFNVCLQSNPDAAFVYDDERLVQQAGDVHWFRNDVDHEVVNEGADSHIILTVCIHLDRGARVPWSPEGWTMDGSRIQPAEVK